MAALPPPEQVAGIHVATYESYLKLAHPAGNGTIAAPDAAAFLKKSGLSDLILSQIWELSDPTSKGFLDRNGFFVALKLIALAQSGKEMAMVNLLTPSPPPNMGPISANMGGTGEWAIPASEITKYNQIFEGLQPVNGLLAGDKVRPVLLNSKLPVDVLGCVWDLSDIDNDGFLDQEEFAIAMHLVYRALEKEPVPQTLPPSLIPPGKRRKGSIMAGAVPVLPGPAPSIPAAPAIPGPPAVTATGRNSPGMSGSPMRRQSASTAKPAVTWVISPTEQAKFDEMFKTADLDKDGFVSGAEIKDLFIQSGVPQQVLAHIWNLCDTKGLGKLNKEQFALAMYLIEESLKGLEPPQTLPPDMVPPSMREVDGLASLKTTESSSSKELDEISKEIEDLKREKMQLEKDKAQKEADIQIRNGEVATLQKEQDAITLTLTQLENQKAEAQKRLDDLDDKRTQLENSVKELKEKCGDEQKSIENLRSQLVTQEMSVKTKEHEVTRMREELSQLRTEEADLEKKVESSSRQLEQMKSNFTDSSSLIEQTKLKLQQLEVNQKSINDGIDQFNALISGDPNAQEPPALESIASSDDIISTKATNGSTSLGSLGGFSFESSGDPFKEKDPFAGVNGENDPFSDDPFKGSDPFKQEGFGDGDPFGGSDPFTDTFGAAQQSSFSPPHQQQQDKFDQFKGDPFKNGDESFEAAFSAAKNKKSASADPFDPFGSGGRVPDLTSPDMSFGTDPFGADPFNPTSSKKKGPSPTPALPPKQKRAAPPRPPAPKDSRLSPNPMAGPQVTSSSSKSKSEFSPDPFGDSDPFGGPVGGGMNKSDPFDGFADFSPSKFEPVVKQDDPMAQALRESQALEDERKRQQEQEQADLELAIQLSKQEITSSEA